MKSFNDIDFACENCGGIGYEIDYYGNKIGGCVGHIDHNDEKRIFLQCQLKSINLAIGLIHESDPQWDELHQLKDYYKKQLEEL